jgi:hypothetical protein
LAGNSKGRNQDLKSGLKCPNDGEMVPATLSSVVDKTWALEPLGRYKMVHSSFD